MERSYIARQPIPIKIESIDDGDVLARFSEANIAIGGTNEKDAFQGIFAEILDIFDSLTEQEAILGPDASRQLQILRRYIAKT